MLKIILVRPARFERATTWFEAKYSNPLSYGRIIKMDSHWLKLYHMMRLGYTVFMDVRMSIPLKNFTTMKLGGKARFMVTVTSVDEAVTAYQNAKKQNIPIFILGGGSNVLARDEGYPGLVILNRIMGFEVLSDDKSSVLIRVGAGEVWDEVVERVVERGLSGIETLSAIPGTAGAAPVQNIGAYGQEVADTLVSVEAYDSHTGQVVTITAENCGLSYRHSIFRGEWIGRYCIIAITLRLYYASPQPPFYAALQRYFDEHKIDMYTSKIIRDAVIAIRQDKLPNPKDKPNAGSFFKNAIIESWQHEELKKEYPDMPSYDMPGGNYKIPTGWLIEQTGLKGQLLNGMRIHDKNALVLINESATSYADLSEARSRVIQQVYDSFRIQIEQEPLELA